MTDRHPAAGARVATGVFTGLAFIGMVAGYQASAAAPELGVMYPCVSRSRDSRLVLAL